MGLDSKSRSLANYPEDIRNRVLDEYAADAVGHVHLLLEDLRIDSSLGLIDPDRVLRCALFLGEGSVEKLREAVKLGRTDARDLIVAAEYDRSMTRLRDFSHPVKP